MRSNWKLRSRSAWWIGSFIALTGLMSQSLCGQSSTSDGEPRERLVVLNTGRILSGYVTRNAGGYLLDQPNGRMQLVENEVLFVADDMHEAYRKQRDSVRFPTPASHLGLAKWCISFQLYDEARIELKKCLESQPENEDARRLLQRLTDTMRANLPAAPAPATPSRSSDGFNQPNVESLGGLTRDAAMQFTSKIQPLLLNKCGNASCHGSAATNDFHLVAARTGSNGSRQLTERNLAETLKQLNLDDVRASPLLNATAGGHGGKGTIFNGQAGSDQLKLLKTWAKTVAQERQAQNAELANRPTIKSKHATKQPRAAYPTAEVKTASYVEDETELPREEVPAASRKATPSSFEPEPKPRELPPRQLPTETVEEAEAELKPVDPFDPEIFNRKFH